ncbi:hypothetical protein ScPMuIL_000212 [Solemya velum]
MRKKMVDQDDEYPNEISIPKGGTLRIGGSLDEDETDPFRGEITCFSMYGHVLDPSDVSETDQDCLPENWRVIPRVVMAENPDVEGEQCFSNGTSGDGDHATEFPEQRTVTLNDLTVGSRWNELLQKYQWHESSRHFGYFRLMSRNEMPTSEDSMLGIVNTTNMMVCSRLCMRIGSCRSFLVGPSTEHNSCSLYSAIQKNNLKEVDDSRYYITEE